MIYRFADGWAVVQAGVVVDVHPIQSGCFLKPLDALFDWLRLTQRAWAVVE